MARALYAVKCEGGQGLQGGVPGDSKGEEAFAACRLLIVAASLGGGGAERVMTTLLRHLDRRRFELHLALVDASGPYLSQIPKNVSVHDLRARRVRYAFLPIIRLVRCLRPSVVFSTLGYLNLAVIAGRSFWPPGIRLWVREANIPSVSLKNAERGAWLRRLYPRLYRRADGIVCVTGEIREDLARTFRVPAGKLRVIGNPVDEEVVRLRAAEKGTALNDRKVHVMAAGRLTRQKGFDLLVRAAAAILKRRADVQLTILGTGPERQGLQDLADSLGVLDSIHMPGFTENPYGYFKAADLFVLSSRWEGLPNVVLEALACGTPVVAFDCPGGGVREIARETSGVSVVPPGDVDALGQAIAKELEGKRPKPGGSLMPARFRVGPVVRAYEENLFSGSGG